MKNGSNTWKWNWVSCGVDYGAGNERKDMKSLWVATFLLWCGKWGSTQCLAYTIPSFRSRAKTTEAPSLRWTQRRVLGKSFPHRPFESKTFLGSNSEHPFSEDTSDGYNDWLFANREQRVACYATLALAETWFWYCGAPGIDPNSRWFNPADGALIQSLLDPPTVFDPPLGSGLGFSSLLLNSFLVLPAIWSLLLLQEPERNQDAGDGRVQNFNTKLLSALRIGSCAAGFLVGGGILVPFMGFRRPLPLRRSIDPSGFPAPLRLFEEAPKTPDSTSEDIPVALPAGQIMLLALASVVLLSFFLPLFQESRDWGIEWNAFLERAQSSQFTALALYDLTMISLAILDPMMDDALRRGYVAGWKENCDDDEGEPSIDAWKRHHRIPAVARLAPFVVLPWIGPVAWICLRPRYPLQEDSEP